MQWSGARVPCEESRLAKVRLRVIDFEDLDAELFEGIDVLVSCLGTTKGDAGSDEGR